LLAGLTELEAEDLLSAQSSGTIHVVAGVTPDAYCVRSSGGASCSVLAWAAAQAEHRSPDTIIISCAGGQLRACFAAQRARANPPVGIGPTYITAVYALVNVAGVRERFGIPAGADPFDIYDLFARRGLIDYAPLPTDVQNMQHVWNSEPAR
jgi:hypothetical protein